MKRVCLPLVFSIMLLCTLSGCSGYDILQYKVPSTEERISVRIEKSDGFALEANEDGTFTIMRDNNLIATGVLLPLDKVQKMRTNAKAMEACEILEEGRQDNLEFLLLKINTSGEEWVYLVFIDGMEAGLALNSAISEEALRACFTALSLRAAKE